MKDLLQYLQTAWTKAGEPEVAAYLAIVIAVLPLFSKLGAWLLKSWRQRKLRKDLFPYYTEMDIQRATQYYVETTCQNLAPSKEDEPGRIHAFATREKIIPFFLKKALKPKKDDCQFYIVLADSGMGKTTFMINLYLRYVEQFLKPKYEIKLLPLGFPDVDREIAKIPEKDRRNTILLLDAFDEDIEAVEDYKSRLKALIDTVVHFREVVITCRTQFFPSEEEEPKESGVMRFGGDGGMRHFYKLYLSPFDDKDVRSYLRKRFGWFHPLKKRKARQIVDLSPNLMARPMLLSYVEDLLQNQRPYTATYLVYAELIAKWVERETGKMPPERKKHYQEELFNFSREIAHNIYEKREERHGALMIPGDDILPFAKKHGIKLKELEMKSRSLLNRNARGEYKFSHKSVLEYFLAEELFFNRDFLRAFDFDGMNQARAFLDEMIWEKLTLSFFSRDDLEGEYSVQGGKFRPLDKLTIKLLPQVTSLNLQNWGEDEDALALRGLKLLNRFYVGRLTAEQECDLQNNLPDCSLRVTFHLPLRHKPLTVSSEEKEEVFLLNKSSKPFGYLQSQYQEQEELVVDSTTCLTWQKSGSAELLDYAEAEEYVRKLNKQEFAGHQDWRLPTIPELMSLLEPEEQDNGLYINTVFYKRQTWCWSCDKRSSGSAWLVRFDYGSVNWNLVKSTYYVRVVRS